MKKIFQKITAVITAAVVLSASVGFDFPESLTAQAAEAATSGTCGATGNETNVTWSFDASNGKLTISGTGAMADYDNGNLAPWKSYSESITNVEISSGVTYIGSFAFYGCNMPSIVIPENVNGIGSFAFHCCSKLTSVNIPSNVQTIDTCTFFNCGLTSIIIPGSVKTIGESAFCGCDSLTSITIPNSVTSISSQAFKGCTKLATVTIKGAASIGQSAFQDCTSLNNVTMENVTSIGGGAFYNCTGLTEITIPEGVEIINGTTFYMCNSLTSISIPDSVKSIGSYAFNCCTGLTSVTIKGAESIGASAFASCSALTSVTIPKNVTTIDGGAFYDCRNLTNVNFKPSNPPSMGTNVFKQCAFLNDNDNATGIRVPEGCVDAYKTKWNSSSTFPEFANNIATNHMHTPCGAISNTACSHRNGCSSALRFDQKITSDTTMLATGGNYYLAEDVTISDPITISGTTGGTVNICLNGYTIKGTGSSVFEIQNSVNVNICDCNNSGNAIIENNSQSCIQFSDGISAVLFIYGGIIKSYSNAKGVNLSTNGTLNMYGGEINTVDNAIYVPGNARANIYGGEIICSGTKTISINSGATANISGGTITNTKVGSNKDTVTKNCGTAIYNLGDLEISGDAEVICTDTYGQAIINGDDASGADNSNVSLTITGGTATSKGRRTILTNAGTEVTISGGAIINTKEGNNTTSGCGTAIENLGTLKISGSAAVTSTGRDGTVIHNGNKDSKPKAILEIKGGTFTSAKEGVSYNLYNCEGSEITVLKGNFEQTRQALYNCNGAVATISNITINGTGNTAPLCNFGTLTLTDVNVTSSSFALQNSEGANLEINGGTFSSSVYTTLSNYKNATATISGATIENTYDSNNSQAIDNKGAITIKGEAKISSVNGKAIINGNSANSADNTGVSVKIEGGTITSSGSCTLQNNKGAEATISGGTIENTKAESGTSNVAIENTGGTVTITGGTVKSKNTAIKNSAFNGKGTTILKKEGEGDGATITSSGVYTLANFSGATVTISGGTIHNTRGSGSGYSDAIAIFNEGNLDISSGTVQSDLNLALKNLATTGTGATISGGTLYGGGNSCIYNGGNLKIQEGCSINAGSFPVSNVNNGDLTISGGTYKSSNGNISNSGTLKLSGNPTFTKTGIRLNGTTVINITGALNFNGALCPIYVDDNPVTADSPVTFTTGWNTHMSGKKPSAYFKSGLKYCTVDTKNNEGILRPFKVTFNHSDYTGEKGEDTKYVNAQAKLDSFPEPHTRKGYIFKFWDDSAGSTSGKVFTVDSIFTGDTHLYARWEECTAHEWEYSNIENADTHTQTCKLCGKKEENVAHSWKVTSTTQPTCAAEGSETSTCACGKTKTITLDKTSNHVYRSEVTAEPTIDSEGVRTYTCSCGDTYTDSIPKLPSADHKHNYTSEVTRAATCTVNGVKTYTCGCTDSYTETILATGHNYTSKITTEPTVDRVGVRTYTCSTCNDTYTDSIPMLPKSDHEHNYTSAVTKAATCTVNGVKTYSCECGDSYIETIPATGHKYSSEVTTEPTVDSEGVRTYTCSNCGDTYTESIAKLEDNPTTDTPSTPSWPGSSSGSGGSSGSGSSNNPVVNGKEQSWTDILGEVKEIPDGGKLTVNLNGNATVPADVIKDIANKDAVVTFKLNSEISYVVDGAKLSGKVSFADLSVGESKTELSTTNFSELGGTAAKQFTLGRFSITSKMSFSLDKANAGKFASLMKLNAKTGKYDFVSVAKIDANGKALVDVNGKGDYLLIIDSETKKPGDLNNDTLINSKDALELLKGIVYELSMNDFKSDYNGDGKTNSKDALDILKVIVGLLPDKYNQLA